MTDFRIRPLAAAAAVVALALAGWARAESVTYYQVTYTDGSVRDLAAVPDTNAGIGRVLRITRSDEGSNGRQISSTAGRGVTVIAEGRTDSQKLRWDGKAWVAPEPEPAKADNAIQAEFARLHEAIESELAALQAAAETVAKRTAAARQASGADLAAARQAVIDAQAEQIERLSRIVRLQQALLDSLTGPAALNRTTGTVRVLTIGPAAEWDYGVARPSGRGSTMSDRVRVWPLPPGVGPRVITVSMAHCAAGPRGAFHYVAYADTDGDGTPDELIANSPPASADRARAWTSWDFTTDARNVFVGQAWADDNVVISTTPATPDNWRGLGTDVYVSGIFGGVPCRRLVGWPVVGDIRVRVAPQNPP